MESPPHTLPTTLWLYKNGGYFQNNVLGERETWTNLTTKLEKK